MLDTNTVSQIVRRNPLALDRLLAVPIRHVCLSSITEAELLFGLAKRPEATRLKSAVQAFLRRVDVLAWDSRASHSYAVARASLERDGKSIAPPDLLIGAHALSHSSVLVTNDQAFRHLSDLSLEDWTT